MVWRKPEAPLAALKDLTLRPRYEEPVYKIETPNPKPFDVNQPFIRRVVWGFRGGYELDRDTQIADAYGDGENYTLERLRKPEVSDIRKRILAGRLAVENTGSLHSVVLYDRRSGGYMADMRARRSQTS